MSTSPPGILEQCLTCCLFLGSYQFINISEYIHLYMRIWIHFMYKIMLKLWFMFIPRLNFILSHRLSYQMMCALGTSNPITSFSYPNYLIMALDGTNPTKSKTQTRMDSWTLFCGQVNQITYLWRCSRHNWTTPWFSVYLMPWYWELNQHDPLDSHDARGW